MLQHVLVLQAVSAILFVLAGIMLYAANEAASSRSARLMVISSLLSVCGAIGFMLKAYAGEEELNLQRAGPIKRTAATGERGYFEFEDEDGTGGAGRGTPGKGGIHRILAAFDVSKETTPVVLRDCPACPEMVVVPRGYFRMGAGPSDADATVAERPTRVVRIGTQLAVGRSEITVGQYRAYVTETGRQLPACSVAPDFSDTTLPITCVSWNDTQGYLSWLNARSGLRYRLLSEAEWEYAARAGSTERYATGATLPVGAANVGGEKGRAVAVASYRRNAYGLYDMHGNAAELTADCWKPSPSDLRGDGRAAQAKLNCTHRSLRDASATETALAARVSARRPIDPDVRIPGVGFRVARAMK